MVFDKNYFEYYAKLTLETLSDERLNNLEKSECPDWVTPNREIGVEVTRAVIQEWEEESAHVETYFGQNLSGDEILKKVAAKCKKPLNGELNVFRINDTDNVAVYSPTKGLFSASIIIDTVIRSINNKNSKIAKYEKCKEIWLYIFPGLSLLEHDIEIIAEYFQNIKHYLIDKLIINTVADLYILEKNVPVKVINISSEKLAHYKEEAQRMGGKYVLR